MTNRINVLDPITANQIAAGEVVERPASVVKELVENSIDAGGTRIEVEVNRAGMDLIRVTDNGCGMSQEDAVLAFQRHATSKIRTPSDLAAICSLGFRGEALPSIASVSRTQLLTRERNVLSGTQVFVTGGNLDGVQDAGGPAGTTFVVRDLFFNTPARRKFLKSEATELGQISDLLNRVVMACPGISFKFVSQGRILMQTSGGGNLLECISQVYGRELAREMIPVRAQNGEAIIEGYLGRPHTSRASRNCQSFFINGRYVKSRLLTRAVAEGYHTMLPGNRYPVIVLKLTLPVNTVDVNVHPTKLEVRFAQEAELTGFITAAVREALTGAVPIPGLPAMEPGRSYEGEKTTSFHCGGVEAKDVAVASGDRPTGSGGHVKQLQLHLGAKPYSNAVDKATTQTNHMREDCFPGYHETDSRRASDQSTFLTPDSSVQAGVHSCRQDATLNFEIGDRNLPASAAGQAPAACEENHATEFLAAPDETESKLPDLLPLGQVDSTYIVARGPEGLYILDQHAAHERINYERLWAAAANAYGETQLLLEPLTVDFTHQELQLLVENIILFNNLGFLLEFFGGSTFLLRGKPADLNEDPRILLRDLLELFIDGPPKIDPRKLREEFIYLLACKASVKAREVLTREEMERLILRLGQTENPFTCPHGRPTIIAITGAELAKRFQRV